MVMGLLKRQRDAELIKDRAAKERMPGESSAAAFCRLYEAPDNDGLALRKAVQISKGIGHPHV
jgi:hypothetical protein